MLFHPWDLLSTMKHHVWVSFLSCSGALHLSTCTLILPFLSPGLENESILPSLQTHLCIVTILPTGLEMWLHINSIKYCKMTQLFHFRQTFSLNKSKPPIFSWTHSTGDTQGYFNPHFSTFLHWSLYSPTCVIFSTMYYSFCLQVRFLLLYLI